MVVSGAIALISSRVGDRRPARRRIHHHQQLARNADLVAVMQLAHSFDARSLHERAVFAAEVFAGGTAVDDEDARMSSRNARRIVANQCVVIAADDVLTVEQIDLALPDADSNPRETFFPPHATHESVSISMRGPDESRLFTIVAESGAQLGDVDGKVGF